MIGEGDRLRALFNFSNDGEVRVGGLGRRCSGSPLTCEKVIIKDKSEFGTLDHEIQDNTVMNGVLHFIPLFFVHYL